MARPALGNGTPSDPSEPPKQWGVLRPDAVREIFLQRPPRNHDGTFKPSSTSSHRLAALHGVTERAIREVWNRNSWRKLTRPLWTEEEVLADLATLQPSMEAPGMVKQRRVGRPKGSFSKHKRACKQAFGSNASPSSPSDMSAPSIVIDFARVKEDAPSIVIDFAKAEEDAEFGDPFQEDW
eukprot:1432967-Rhodomonas_salina.1